MNIVRVVKLHEPDSELECDCWTDLYKRQPSELFIGTWVSWH